jgi:hypothetical protein
MTRKMREIIDALHDEIRGLQDHNAHLQAELDEARKIIDECRSASVTAAVRWGLRAKRITEGLGTRDA